MRLRGLRGFGLHSPLPCWKARGRHPKRGCVHARADLYSILQVSESATKAEIRAAYRQLAKKLHPDINGGRDLRRHFQAVTDAYSVLSNDGRRERYNRIGYAALGPGFARYGAHFDREQRRPPEPGKDVMSVMWLDLVEAALGIERCVQVRVAVVCPECEGVRSKAALTLPCTTCRGSGEIVQLDSGKQGSPRHPGPCPGCGGKGSQVQQWCQRCGSRGLARIQRTVTVKVPPGSARFVVPRLAGDAGVDNNSVLRLKGSGDEGRFGGRPGDLYLSFVIRSRPDILRRGLDLISQITVAYTDAILGSVYQVQTIRGKADLVIPAGTQHGAVLKLPGAGVQAAAGRSGECTGFHLFKVTVRLPVEVDNQDRRLLERLVAVQGQAC